jgi:hypothetical protein
MLTISSLDLLNQLMDVAVSTQGAYGVKIWLIEVQAFTRQLQKRMFQGMPLMPQERQAGELTIPCHAYVRWSS